MTAVVQLECNMCGTVGLCTKTNLYTQVQCCDYMVMAFPLLCPHPLCFLLSSPLVIPLTSTSHPSTLLPNLTITLLSSFLHSLGGGELFYFLQEREYLCEADAVAYIRQLVLALAHLHSQQICHLDLKVYSQPLMCAQLWSGTVGRVYEVK